MVADSAFDLGGGVNRQIGSLVSMHQQRQPYAASSEHVRDRDGHPDS